MKIPRLRYRMHMIIVFGTLHGILLDIFFAVVAMITLPNFGAETGLGMQLMINSTLEQTEVLASKTLLWEVAYLVRSQCLCPPSTPGPFGAGLTRMEGTIPGVGVAMPLSVPSLDSSTLGEQKPPMSLGAPPLPPGPHPSLLAGNQQQPYQQNAPQQQHQSSMPLPPNMSHLQPSSHLHMLQHPHLPRPPPQIQPHNMPSNVPSSMPGSLSVQSMPMPGPMGIQGGMNQMIPPSPQAHFMGMNPMPSGSGPPRNMPPGGIPNGLPNMQGPPNVSGNQMYSPAGGFSRLQAGQMPMMPGLNPYQPGNPNAPGMLSNFGLPSGTTLLPPGPTPHGQPHQ